MILFSLRVRSSFFFFVAVVEKRVENRCSFYPMFCFILDTYPVTDIFHFSKMIEDDVSVYENSKNSESARGENT